MPGTSAAHTIWFIAAILVAAALAGAIVGITYSISKGLNNKADQLEGAMSTKIKIINDPKRVPYNVSTETVTFYVSNIGSTILNKDPKSVLVLINGIASSQPASISIYSGSQSWKTGEVGMVNVTVTGLTFNVDYNVWISVSDSKTGAAATDSLSFNIVIVP